MIKFMRKGQLDKMNSAKLAVQAVKSMEAGQELTEVLSPIADNFKYSNWRTVYNNMRDYINTDLDLKIWWEQTKRLRQKNAGRKPKNQS